MEEERERMEVGYARNMEDERKKGGKRKWRNMGEREVLKKHGGNTGEEIGAEGGGKSGC